MIKKLWERTMTIPFSGCWVFMGALTSQGYGNVGWDSVHRISYRHFKGAIPENYEIDHKCKVRSCWNPDHLEAVTHLENVRRGPKAQQTHCINGHPFNDINTRYRKEGRRVCRACASIRNRSYKYGDL